MNSSPCLTPVRRSPLGWAWSSIALVVSLYVYVGLAANPARVSAEPNGYYALLADALLSGQLHLKLEPDARLLALENPYAGNQGVSRPHDMTYFGGKFYLCYGIPPFLLIGGPWTLLTGTFLSDGMLTTVLMTTAFLLSALWYLSLRQRHLPNLPPGADAIAIAFLGLGNFSLFGVTNSTFYLPPISSGWLGAMGMIFAMERAWAARSPHRAITWLALASASGGLMVLGRPNTILALPWIALPAAYLIWHWPAANRRPRDIVRVLFWMIFPAAALGLGQACYNAMRFADPLEFGQRFTMNPQDVRDIVFFDPSRFGHTFRAYVWNPVDFSAYFPFLRAPSPDVIGTVRYAPLLWLLPLGFFPVWGRIAGSNVQWQLRLATVIGMATSNLVLLSFFVGYNDRYILDFLPTALLGGLLAALLIWHRAGRLSSPLGRRSLKSIVVGAALGTTAISTAFWMDEMARAPGWSTLARLANYPTAWAEDLLGIEQGPMTMKVRFPTDAAGTTEPLLSTGEQTGRTDVVYVHYLDDQHIQLGFFHSGSGGPLSPPIALDYGQSHQLEIELGSLYPPETHPDFGDWPKGLVRQLKARLRVSLNGTEVLNGYAAYYPADFTEVYPGENHDVPDLSRPLFSGRIEALQRRGIPDRPKSDGPALQAIRMNLRFPQVADWVSQPLLAFGEPQNGDTIFVTYLPGNKLRFGHDHQGGGAVLTATVDYDPTQTYTIEIDPGTADGNFRLRFNSRLLIDINRPFYPARGDDVALGFDLAESSVVDVMFSGTIFDAEPVDASDWKLQPQGFGAINTFVRFPLNGAGTLEPLLTTGETGRGDFIYVRFIDGTHVRFGHDHWGFPSLESPPIAIDFHEPHELGIIVPGLIPPAALRSLDPEIQTALMKRVFVVLDGKVVFEAEREFHPFNPASIGILQNTIGGSTCGPVFTGDILVRSQSLPDSGDYPWAGVLSYLSSQTPSSSSQEVR